MTRGGGVEARSRGRRGAEAAHERRAGAPRTEIGELDEVAGDENILCRREGGWVGGVRRGCAVLSSVNGFALRLGRRHGPAPRRRRCAEEVGACEALRLAERAGCAGLSGDGTWCCAAATQPSRRSEAAAPGLRSRWKKP